VSLDMTTLTIMRILPREVDPMVSRPIGRHPISKRDSPLPPDTFLSQGEKGRGGVNERRRKELMTGIQHVP